MLRARPPLSINDLAIDGGDLKGIGIEPGPAYGRIMRALLDRVLEEPSLNEHDRLIEIVRTELAE